MKALTIKQPWAKLIFEAGKDIENRDWPTSVRGRVAIHTSAKLSWEDWLEAELQLVHMRSIGLTKFELPRAGIIPGRGDSYRFQSMPEGVHCGVILGTVEIVDCVRSSSSPWFFGTRGFVLREPVLFPAAIPAKGKQGWWEWPEGDALAISGGAR